MKIQIASDLHLDLLQDRFPGYRVIEPAPDADVLVIAGDIHQQAGAVQAFADWPVPVVYVHGNHEAYHTSIDELVGTLRRAAQGTAVHYLEGGECVLGGVRFLGCCLWTDYDLYPGRQAEAMEEAERCLLDHRAIHTPDGMFAAADALRMHRTSRAWLESQLSRRFDGPTVVVTHHGPHPRSVHARYAGTVLNAAFVSDLTPLLGRPQLWVHGHVHDSFDYLAGGTRVVANPRGYALNRRIAASTAEIDWENKLFDNQYVVEL
ncbi:MAG TPA: metallophosphoesterase [Noviherbaspirillum sp.]|uniref:metallophosphoesterase n=1 Tax=Noviherbaspirillum sp. TaxID=1926288 RepID=UPI002D4E2C6A|nr:metallophosphoesterase [Noviherbaspirillum sp.]HYD94376.1 metallophosphoesterase [Noviherbaspirillum sp.]